MAKSYTRIQEGDVVYVINNTQGLPEQRIACKVDTSMLGRTIVYTVTKNPLGGIRNERLHENELGVDLFCTMKEAFANRHRLMRRRQNTRNPI